VKLLDLMILKCGEMALFFHSLELILRRLKWKQKSKKECGLGQWVEVCHHYLM